MRPLSPALQQLLAAGGGRVVVDARIETAADVRQRADQWQACDGGLPANLVVLSDGGLTLKATAGAAVGPTNHGSFYHAKEAALYTAPFIDPLTDAYGLGTTFAGVLAEWVDSAAQVAYGSLQAWLNPLYDTAGTKYVQTWEVVLYAVRSNATNGDATAATAWQLVPILRVQVPALNEAAGWVVFPFQDAAGIAQPFRPVAPGPGQRLQVFIVCHGYDGNGKPATNIAWGYDGAASSFVTGSTLQMRGWAIKPPSNSTRISGFGDADNGGSINIAALQFIPVSYASATTLTFKTGSPIDLGATPGTAPEFVVEAETPAGTSVLAEAAVDPAGSFVTVKDGQLTSDVGLATQQKYDSRITLTPSASGDRAPIVRGLGMRVVTRKDLGDVAEVIAMQSRTDAITHASEVDEITIRAGHHGDRDFHDEISELVSQQGPGQFAFRVFVGDRSLSRDQWLFVDDYFPDDQLLHPEAVEIPAVSCLSLLRQAIPVLTGDLVALPSTLSSNPGLWTASSGTALPPKLADTALDGSGAAPDDTTYCQSPANPVNAAFTVTLTAISTPAQLVGATIQFRAAVVAASSPTLKVELLEGATVRATKQVTVSNVDAGQGSYAPTQYSLSAAEQAAIGNWGNLLLRFTANGTGQVRVGWARLVVLGGRFPLVYPSSATPANTIAGCLTDLITSQLGLDARYQGPRYADPSPALPVAKTIASASGGSTDLSRVKQELDALAFLSGGAFISSMGRVAYKALYQVTTYTDLVTGSATASFAPLTGPVRVFDLGEIEPVSVSAGWRQRIPIYAVPWGWNGIRYQSEASVTNGAALNFYRAAMIDADARCPEAAAQWISGEGLARGLAIRHSQAFGLGLLEWRFRCTMPHPELEVGDVIVLQTDQFLAYDPIANRALAGKLWVQGVIVGRWDALGREWSVWIQTLSAIKPVATAVSTPLINPIDPGSLGVSGYVGEAAGDATGDNLNVFWSGTSAVQAVKIAASTSSFPAAGSGTLYTGTQGTAVVSGPFVFGTAVYVTITPYADSAGSTAAGVPGKLVKLIDGSSVSTPYNNQGSVPPQTMDNTPYSYSSWCPSVGTRGGIRWTWTAFNVYRADGTSIAIPASSAQTLPGTPTLSQVAGGALGARTRFVRIALVKDKMMHGIGAEASFSVSANNLLKVTSPGPVTGYDGWIPLCSDTTNTEVEQVGAGLPDMTHPIAFGTDWTEPAAGCTIPTGNNSQYNDDATQTGIHDWNLSSNTTWYFYPYWDIAHSLVSMCGGSGLSSRSASLAAQQNGDGRIALNAGAMSAAVPAVGGGGAGSGGYTTCLEAATQVETRARGLGPLGQCVVGDELRAPSGWVRVRHLDRMPWREWMRVTAANGESVLATATHPFTTANRGVVRAHELTLDDYLIVPDGFAPVVRLERVVQDSVKISIECEPTREFWAGERAPRLLTHNAQVTS